MDVAELKYNFQIDSRKMYSSHSFDVGNNGQIFTDVSRDFHIVRFVLLRLSLSLSFFLSLFHFSHLIWIFNDIQCINTHITVYTFDAHVHIQKMCKTIRKCSSAASVQCIHSAYLCTNISFEINLNAHFNLLIYSHLLSPITFDHLKWLNLIEFNWQKWSLWCCWCFGTP